VGVGPYVGWFTILECKNYHEGIWFKSVLVLYQ
jgi:hypothetical protein